MKKMMVILAVLVFVSLFGSTLCQAQTESPNFWVIGKWKGFQEGAPKNIWMLEMVEQGGLNGSLMWVTETSKMSPISIIGIQNNTLTFQSSSKKEFVLSRVSDNRMEGKYTNSDGNKIEIRFWKEGEANASPLLGNYEAKWRESWLEASLEVLYIDDTAMTGIYRYKDLPTKGIKAGMFYVNGKLTSERKYIVQQFNKEYQFSFLFKEGGEKILAEVLYNGECVNTATFKKK